MELDLSRPQINKKPEICLLFEDVGAVRGAIAADATRTTSNTLQSPTWGPFLDP